MTHPCKVATRFLVVPARRKADVTQPDESSVAIAKLIASRLIERRDVKAQQHDRGYSPVREHITRERHDDHSNCPSVPWALRDIISHVEGAATFGHYVVSRENTCRIFAFDIDLMATGEWLDTDSQGWIRCEPRKVWLDPADTRAKGDLRSQLFCMAAGLASAINTVLGMKCAVAYSGSKGMHVYGFLDPGTPAADARDAAVAVLQYFDDAFTQSRGANFWRHAEEFRALEIEVYPKQDSIRDGDGFGNLLRLPLGVNRKTGQRGFFVKLHHNEPLNDPFIEDDPIVALESGSYRIGAKA